MNHADKQYKELIEEILNKGDDKDDRTGTGTKAIFGHQMRFDLQKGFPLITLKYTWFKGIVHELLWFLNSVPKKYRYFGNTNIKYLIDHGVNIWNDWPYQRLKQEQENLYLGGHNIETLEEREKILSIQSQEQFTNRIKNDDEFAKKWGELGPVYGKQWREWNRCCSKFCSKHQPIDQIEGVIQSIKEKPYSRRHIITDWNVADIDKMLLPPCHGIVIQFYVNSLTYNERIEWFINNYYETGMEKEVIKEEFKDEDLDNIKWYGDNISIPKHKLSCQAYTRSQDLFLGQPFNIASYSLLIHLIAQQTNTIPNELIYTIGDCHLYLNHIEQAKKLINRDNKFNLPKIEINKKDSIDDYRYDDFNLKNYNYHPRIKAPVAV